MTSFFFTRSPQVSLQWLSFGHRLHDTFPNLDPASSRIFRPAVKCLLYREFSIVFFLLLLMLIKKSLAITLFHLSESCHNILSFNCQREFLLAKSIKTSHKNVMGMVCSLQRIMRANVAYCYSASEH